MRYTWLVEKYLEGELGDEELHKFELEILRNPEAAKELEEIRNLQKYMEKQHARRNGDDGLMEDFEDIENVLSESEMSEELEGLRVRKLDRDIRAQNDFITSLVESEAGRTLKIRKSNKLIIKKISVWVAAASITLLIATSALLIFSPDRSLDNQAVYNMYYTPEKADIAQRTSSFQENDPNYAALEIYNAGRFPEALELFNQIPEPYSAQKLYLYKGITLMELGRHEEAIHQFSQLESDPVLNHYGMWYSGLCYLALKDSNNAKSVFQDIVDHDGHYLKKSKAILRRI
jgi:tetratricopeptide (TPR) repeat protein